MNSHKVITGLVLSGLLALAALAGIPNAMNQRNVGVTAWDYTPPGGGGGSPAFVKSAIGTTTDNETVVTSFGSLPTAGNTVVAVVTIYNQSSASDFPSAGDLTDNQGNTYTLVQVGRDTFNSNTCVTAIYVCHGISVTGGTFTATWDTTAGSSTWPRMVLAEFSGVSVSGNSNYGFAESGTAVTTNAVDYDGIFVGGMTHSAVTRSITLGAGFTLITEEEDAGYMPISVGYKIGTANEAMTWTTAGSAQWTAVGVELTN